MRLRISIALAAAVAAIAVLVIGVGTAAASVPGPSGAPDPQTTNIPYVAWIGETLKVSKCFGFADGVTEATAQSSLGGTLLPAGTVNVTDWSGVDEVNAGPKVVSQPWAQLTTAGICFSFDITSDKPGLADVLLSLNNNFLTLILGADSLDQHAYKLIWLQDQAPVINEQAGANLGDPAGDGVFNPIPQSGGGNAFEPGLIHILVKGTFPLGNDFAGYNHPVVTLPDDWAWLANHFAMDSSPTGSSFGGAAAMRWDIHDDNLTTEGHTDGSFCLSTGATVDAVDNCNGAGSSDADLGPFSNIYGGSSDFAVGPFDPIRPGDTFLPDGKLDAGDAPMPALRVDVSLSADSTVGTLSKADKSDIYIRDASMPASTPHNLYAPFYKAFIPAALPGEGNIIDGGPTTSGVAGHASNNFASFLGFTDPSSIWTTEQAAGLYDYWDTFTLNYSHGWNDCFDASGRPIPLPTGATSVAVYTDEHGEAYVQYNPYPGIVLTPDGNGLCDIYNPGGSSPTIGHSTITADSVYPDRVPNWDAGEKTSNPLAKTVNYASSKILDCIPKATNEAYCVETILDPQGNPVKGAKVEFSTQPGDTLISADSNKFGGYDPSDQYVIHGTPNNRVQILTSSAGQAAIDVVSTNNSCVDVVSENLGTRNGGIGIFRSTDFNPTSGKSCSQGTTPPGGTTGGGGGNTSGGGGNTSAGGQTTAPVVTAAPVAVSTPVPQARTAPAAATHTMTLASARVVKVKVGKHSARYLMVRVNGAAKTAKLKITLVSKNGRSVVTRYVRTNRQVRVGHLKLAPTIRSVRVALA